ncbi:calcium/sodium antiporter [Deinococcus sp. Marseille-Q6407]|uniref:calcium/sodium antiporter n=1 Tax=Deinococcus sp. Marseille-Q6407 TaxID=2969223 RepID=UPI0021C24B86|nr:calcium/sodium antiporter [Deinococcus sp. Marseille-Q6407]
MAFVLVVLGAALLYLGGNLLVSNASALARSFGLTPYVVGLTVVAFGTSSPELAATLSSSLAGTADMALGNVVGSNIANIGLILGLTALVYPLVSRRETVTRELPVMLAVSLLLWPVVQGGVSRAEGALLVGLLLVYLVWQLRQGRAGTAGAEEAQEAAAPEETLEAAPSRGRAVLGAALGVALLVGGAQALVSGATTIAQGFGISERVIGLTMLALGTSLPELASSLIAAARHETDLILGGIIGSNIFNILAILGLTALVRPLPVDVAATQGDIAVMLAFTAALLALMWRRARLGKLGGALLLAGYAAYTWSLF